MLNQVFKVFSGTCEQFVEDAASELSMGWVNPRVGLGRYFFDFWWVGLGRGSEMAETKKLQIFICAEFIEVHYIGGNVVDTDGHA